MPIAPDRVLDTRSALGIATTSPLDGHGSITLSLAGRGGLPEAVEIMAVVVNVTVVDPSAGGYLTVYRAGSPRPLTSNLNFTRSTTLANLMTVPVSAAGEVTIYNAGAASTHVLADVVGYYHSAAPTTSTFGSYFPGGGRLYDTRKESRPLGPGSAIRIRYQYRDELTQYLRALAVNITVVAPSGPGYLTAWSGESPTSVSTINFVRSRTQANMAIVGVQHGYVLEPRGNIATVEFVLLNHSTVSTHVLVDLVGYYDDNTIGSFGLDPPCRFAPLESPARLVDTRQNLGTNPLGPSSAHLVTTPASLLVTDTVGLVTSLAAVSPSRSTYLADQLGLPPSDRTSSLNTTAGVTMANMAMPRLTTAGQFSIYNSQGTTDVIIDVVGIMQAFFSPGVPHSPAH